MRRVLVVDDDEDIRTIFADILSEEGMSVDTACDGFEALERLGRDTLPDVIVLDLMMPNLNGYEFRQRQRSDPRIADVPVVVVTAFSQASHIDAKVLGDVRLIRKPLDVDELITAVERAAV